MPFRYDWGRQGTANMGHMTDRDTFAAAALTGLLADDGDRIDPAMSDFTRRSYEWADAMLLERGSVPHEAIKSTLSNDERRAIMFAIEIFQVEGKNATFEQLTLRKLLKYTLVRLLERTG